MKKLSILIAVLFIGFKSSAHVFYADSIRQQSEKIITPLDSLRQQLDIATNDTVKATLYSQMVARYLDYDKLDTKTKKYYQAQALAYSYLALHSFSSIGDTLGLRNTFDGLAKVYRSQKKYPQAKWFILQSNSLSRAKNDIPNIMASLLVLANIKMEIKDYSLAMRDLDEALKLSRTNHSPKDESHIQQGYVLLYTHLKNYTKADIAAKRHDFIEDSLLRGEEKLVAQTQDSLLVKKKVSPISKKLSKPSYSKKIASL
jgi:tetratricopeptide (TPR) repeat protein